MKRLSVAKLKALNESGMYSDGFGLYINVSKTGSKSWIGRVTFKGRRHEIGLGGFPKVSLALAREKVMALHEKIARGESPLPGAGDNMKVPTFSEAAIQCHEENKTTWKNKKHRAQWISTLQTYVFPKLKNRTVDTITIDNIRDVLLPIWIDKNATAIRVRQRINTVIEWSVGKGYRTETIPMTVVTKSLPKVKKSQRHHAAMPYAQVPAFMDSISELRSVTALAVRTTVLTAVRSSDTRGMRWSEINGNVWTIPASRMKMERDHVVPLTNQVLSVIELAKDLRYADNDLVFQSSKNGGVMSDMTMLEFLRERGMKYTIHGFRSSFKDWASEETNHSNEVSEMALAHKITNAVEAAYRRGTLFDKRRALMNDWADYVC